MSPSRRRPQPARTPTRGRLLIAALLLLLGFAAVVQVRSVQEAPLASAREGDLVQILDDLDNRNARLRAELSRLESAQRELSSGTDRTDAALAETRRRAEVLGVLAGTLPAAGSGVVLTVSDPNRAVGAQVLLDALQELRAAGAEAVQIEGPVNEGPTGEGPADEGTAVRVVASTAFVDVRGGVRVGSTVLSPPYRFTAVGDAATLAQAMRIPGGVVDTVEARGARAAVQERAAVRVDALSRVQPPRYARAS